MNVDEQLRESLRRRAESVEPSPGGWAAINRRIDRRQRRVHTMRLSLAVGTSFAAVALALVMMTTVGHKPDDQNVAATGGSAAARVSTTVQPSTDPESRPDGSSPSTVVGQNGQVDSTGSTIAARPGDPNQPTTRSYTPESVWPETLAELERIQSSVDDGLESWPNDPRAVVAAYLADRNLPFAVGDPTPGVGDDKLEIRYSSGSTVGGRVFLSRLLDGSIYYVSRSESDDISELHVVRQGDQLAVDVTARATGNLDVRTKQPGSDWNDGSHRTVVAGQPVSLTVDGPAGAPLIVQVRLEVDGEIIAVADNYLGQDVLRFDDNALHDGSTLRFGGLGPVSVDMTLAEAERWAGVGMVVTKETESCTSLAPTGQPDGVWFLALNGSGLVDVIVVSDGGVRTAGGIGYGSTLDEVREAYPEAEERITDGRGRVVLAPSRSDPTGTEIVIGVSEDKVNFIWSGREGLSMSDELCA